jgi:hypothetical protein
MLDRGRAHNDFGPMLPLHHRHHVSNLASGLGVDGIAPIKGGEVEFASHLTQGMLLQ